jgi:hypothetical protein
MNQNVFNENEKEAYFYARALYKLSNNDKNFNDLNEEDQKRFKIVAISFVRLVADKIEYNNLKNKFEKLEEQL